MDALDGILERIASRAQSLDISGAWPAEDLADLARAGAMRWAVGTAFGGDGVEPLELHLRYERLAAASLSTALILTQRDSAIGLIDSGGDTPMRAELLPQLAAGRILATIGIAQLTTSRHGGLTATATADGYRLEGTIPWSTGAAHSAFVIAGANVETGGQILFALPTKAAGVEIHAPMRLVALGSSFTTSIDCRGVEIDKRLVLRGPVENVLSARRKGVALSQAFLALGLCRGALDLIATNPSPRAAALHERFAEQLEELRRRVIGLPESDPEHAGPGLRGECNDLALRISHAGVAVFKGHALLLDHPAQRLAREAMFLLVWSCPDPVIECTVDLLSTGRSGS